MGSVEFKQQIGQRNVSLRAKLLSMYVSKSNMMAMAILIISAKQKHISMLPSMHTDGIYSALMHPQALPKSTYTILDLWLF